MTATRNRSIVLMVVVVCSLVGSVSVNACDRRLCDETWMASATVKDVQFEIEKKGADLMSRTKWGFTALHVAASVNPDPAVIAFLVERGANVISPTKKGLTALHFAALLNPNPAVIAFLIESGSNLHAAFESSEKLTPLHLASGGRSVEAQFHFIVELATDMNDLGHLPTLEEIKLRERKFKTELKVFGNKHEIVEVLVNHGANVDARDIWDASPLHHAAAGNMDSRVVRLLLEGGASVDAPIKDGWTPLHMAASFNSNPAISELLIDYGADMETRTTVVGTPLHHAAMNWNPEVSELLLKKGADIEARDDEMMTPLHKTAEWGVLPYVAELLLDHDADLESMDVKGRTPLHIAMEIGMTPFVAMELIERGANMDARDKEGRSPHDIAKIDLAPWSNEKSAEYILNLLHTEYCTNVKSGSYEEKQKEFRAYSTHTLR